MTTELHAPEDQAHGHDDEHGHSLDEPGAAPMHHDIDERFSNLHIAAAAILGSLALVLGTVLGIVLAND